MQTTIDQIKANCHVCEETGCWLWRGALSDGQWPRVYASNYAKADDGSVKTVQTGTRAIWQAKTGRAIPKGWRVWRTCQHDHSNLCLNPEHTICANNAVHGARLAKTGVWKGQVSRIAANRATGRKRSAITPELHAEILGSNETGQALARRTGLNRSVISKVRTGQMQCLAAVGGVFGGLMMKARGAL